MLRQLKWMLKIMGQGLAHQDLGEMSPTANKIAQIEKQSRNYRLSGEQGRIVLIASTDPLGPAFNFVVELAKQTKSLVEVLYIRPADGTKGTLSGLLNRLGDQACDFQITFLTGDLLEKISDYSPQHQDIMAVVCSTSEVLAEKIRSGQQTFDPIVSVTFPSILFISNSIMA